MAATNIDLLAYSDALLVLGTAGVIVPAVHRWRVNPVLTFLVAGAAAGGGLLLGFYLPQHVIAEAAVEGADVFSPNAFIRIRPDNSVTLVMPQVEMGQGTYTSMPMLIAEELEVDLAQVSLEAAPPDDRLYSNPLIGFQVTGGSTSVMAMWEPLRRAGAGLPHPYRGGATGHRRGRRA